MSPWGPLAERFESERPRKLLALDGGGIRGILTLEVLARIESLLAAATGKGIAFRLCDFFDYIAGTSTGAIIAAGLARGMSVQELIAFYQQTGPAMFDKAFLLKRLKALYKSEPLAEELQATFGKQTTLSPADLKCLLLIVTRNVTTDSPWPVSSNPLAKYNQVGRKDCNLQIPLWKLVRASTAAPIFFPPEILQWDPNDPAKTFVFVDGGVTPYNNPAFLLFRMATLPPYKLSWKPGEKNLLLISVGTGAAATLAGDILSPEKNAVANLAGLPGALMYGALVDQDINCRTVGRCVYGAPIDRELGDLIPRDETGAEVPLSEDLGRAFLYARYNAELTRAGLDAIGLPEVDPGLVSRLDSIQSIPDLRRVGEKIGAQVKIAHFGAFVKRTENGT
ncbi:MAG TPA: patatin-like phospholipase family protein [Thermoanaerobaculia bacterium]|nr:patatin-like phospholipase family protein [Thermoanaerobaculia bacterium]